MKGKQGHRPSNNYKTKDQEGVVDKTATRAKGSAKSKHMSGSTASSVGKFGPLRTKDGEGMNDKNYTRR